MALPLPNLDDRTYEQLVAEMVELLPRHNKEWTNRNATDPGVMILELFAYLIEMDIFQLNRISNESYANFLKLVEVDTAGFSNPPTNEEIQNGIRAAVKNLSYIRAITESDMRRVVEDVLLPKGIISRFYSFSDRYIKKNSWEAGSDILKKVHYEMEKAGYTLVILSADNTPFMREQDNPCLTQTVIDRSLGRYTLSDLDLDEVKEQLRQRRMLTNRLYVHQAQIRKIIFYVKIVPEKTADLQALEKNITDKILDFFCPVWGAENEQGFALGRAFKVSEAISVIEEAEGVDYTDEFQAWYEDEPGVWEKVSQIYEPLYYEQIWIESGLVTSPPPQIINGITIEMMAANG